MNPAPTPMAIALSARPPAELPIATAPSPLPFELEPIAIATSPRFVRPAFAPIATELPA